MFSTLFQRSATSIALACITATAVADGVVEGRISDQSGGVFFDGAIVSLNGTNLTTVAKNGGRFRFNNVAAGSYTLNVSYVGADDVEQTLAVSDDQTTSLTVKIGADVEQIENVLVIGQAAGVLSAINQMRGADNLVSIVTSDSIGQLPDENVTEALQRISGVFIERDQGEGRFVGVRGIDPQLNVATINGLNLPSPESDRRNVALDVIPSDLVESLEVTKTLTPDQDGDAIGGTINIKSLSAFDRDGMSYKVTGQYYQNDLEDDDGHKLAASFTNVFDFAGGELGVAVSASTNERNFGTDNLKADGGWSEQGGVRFHENLEMRNYQISRERDGFAMNIDFRPHEDANYYLRTLRSEFSDHELRNRIEFKFDEDDIVFDADSLIENEVELERELKDRLETQEITSILLGGENHVDAWKFEYSLGFSEAKEDEPNRIDTEFENKKIGSAGYNGLGQIPNVTYSADGLDPDNFELKEIVVENNKAKDEETAFKFDITYDMEFGGHPGYVKVGGKYRSREKTNDVNARTFEDFDDALGRDFLLSEFSTGNADYTLGDFGPAINAALVRDFVNTNITRFIEDDEATLLDSARDFTMDEDVTALYLMSRVDIDNLRVVYGLRYEQTDFEANGFNVVAVDVGGLDDTAIEPTRFSKDYSNV